MHLIKMTHPKIRGDNGNHRTEDKLKGLSQNQRLKPGTKAAQFVFLYLPQRQCVLPLHLPVEFLPGNLQIIEVSHIRQELGVTSLRKRSFNLLNFVATFVSVSPRTEAISR